MTSVRLANGPVFTGDRAAPWAEAVLIDGGRIRAVGTLAHVRAVAPAAEEIDLGGRTVVPGFIDAHNHFLATGESLAAVDLRTVTATDRSSFLAAVAEAATNTERGGLVVGYGFDPAKYRDGAPTRWDLDRVAPEHRVVVYHVSGHGALASTSLLDAAGIDDTTPDPPGGSFVRDAAERLTGLCFDAALQRLVPVAVDIGQHGPNFHVAATADALKAAVLRAQSAFVASGLTTVCDAQVTSREMDAYQSVRRQGLLRLRTVCMPLSSQLDAYATTGLTTGFGDSMLHLGPMKFYADGTLIGGTALLAEPYGCDGQHSGHLFRSVDELRTDVLRAHALGWRVGVHVQGDEAIASVLGILNDAQRHHTVADPRPRLEHAGLPDRAHLKLMAGLGAIAVNQPSYLYELGDQFRADLGDRADRLQPMRSELAAGVRFCISSDSDVASYRPLDSVSSALSRRTSGGDVLGADQRLTLDEALFAHTIDAAFAVGREHDLGSLSSGKRADLCIVDGDLRTCPADDIRTLPTWATMIDGEWAHGPGRRAAGVGEEP